MNKEVFSPHKQYRLNITKLIEISQYIDKDNKYSMEINNKMIKDLFKDLRSGGKWYDENQWRPIKAAIHNCYKLLQKGYVPDNQRELESNITILDKLIHEPNPKKIKLEKLSEQVVQNLFDNTLKNLKIKAKQQEKIRKSFDSAPENIRNEFENFEKGKEIPIEIVEGFKDSNSKEDLEKKLEEQKEYFEDKIDKMNSKMKEMEKEIEMLKEIITKIGSICTICK